MLKEEREEKEEEAKKLYEAKVAEYAARGEVYNPEKDEGINGTMIGTMLETSTT